MNAALDQTYRHLQLIVVDDGSVDGSAEIVERISRHDHRVSLIRSGGNCGAAKARNLGIASATGDLTAFLDADDTWERSCLYELYEAIGRDPQVTIAYCGWQNIGAPAGRTAPYVPPDYEKFDGAGIGKIEHILCECPFPIHAALTRSSSIRDAGGFDETLSSCMDFDLWLRIGSCHKMQRVPKVLAYYWHQTDGTQITSNRAKIALNHWRVQRKFLEANPAVALALGSSKVRSLTHDRLFQKGLDAHWHHDPASSRLIFRALLPYFYRDISAWKYLALGLLPIQMYEWIMEMQP